MTDQLDSESIFGDDYLYFYETMLSPERTEREADALWRLLRLEPGHRVLDLGCAYGRMANALARRGAKVTGLDRSATFLVKARADARAGGLTTEYVEGDMRAPGFDGAFDAAFIWFTTFGYFDDADNARVLAGAARALQPGGRFLIEQVNRNMLIQRGASHWTASRGEDRMIDIADWDGLGDRTVTQRLTIRGGILRQRDYAIRMYGYADLARMLGAAGFGHVAAYGRDGEPFATYGDRLIVAARKS